MRFKTDRERGEYPTLRPGLLFLLHAAEAWIEENCGVEAMLTSCMRTREEQRLINIARGAPQERISLHELGLAADIRHGDHRAQSGVPALPGDLPDGAATKFCVFGNTFLRAQSGKRAFYYELTHIHVQIPAGVIVFVGR